VCEDGLFAVVFILLFFLSWLFSNEDIGAFQAIIASASPH
jgi:hypothetical protein